MDVGRILVSEHAHRTYVPRADLDAFIQLLTTIDADGPWLNTRIGLAQRTASDKSLRKPRDPDFRTKMTTEPATPDIR